MTVCLPDGSPATPLPSVRDGTLQVIPEWMGGSLDTYLLWMNSTDPAVKDNVRLFQKEMKRVLRAGLGNPFPEAEMPHVDPRDALALGLREKTSPSGAGVRTAPDRVGRQQHRAAGRHRAHDRTCRPQGRGRDNLPITPHEPCAPCP